MKYSQEEQDKILRKLNAGIIGKRKQGTWDTMSGKMIYTDKQVLEESKKYTLADHFQKNHPGMWMYAKRNNLIKKMTWFDTTSKRKTKEDVFAYIEQGIKDGSIVKYRDLLRSSGMSLYTLKRLGIEREVKEKYFDYDFTPKPKKERVRGKHTLEYAIERAKECKNRTELFKKYQQSYHQLRKNGLLDNYFPKKNK